MINLKMTLSASIGGMRAAVLLVLLFLLQSEGSPMLDALLPDFSPDFPCLPVTYADVAAAVDDVVHVTFSMAFCPPFNDPVLCLSFPNNDCYPREPAKVVAHIDKYDLSCSANLTFEDCLVAILNRTDEDIMRRLNDKDNIDGLVEKAFRYVSANGQGPGSPVPDATTLLPIAVFVGDVIARPNTQIIGYPYDQLDIPLFDTMPYFTNNRLDDCRGLTLGNDNISLFRIGSAASVFCSSTEASSYVIDFTILSDRITSFNCEQCSVAYPNISSTAKHVGVYIGSGGSSDPVAIGRGNSSEITFQALLTDWHDARDILLWAVSITGVTSVSVASSPQSGLQLVSSPDPTLWYPNMTNATSLITPTTMYMRGAPCPTTTVLYDCLMLGAGALGGVVLLGSLWCCESYRGREHYHTLLHVQQVHGITPTPAPPAYTGQNPATTTKPLNSARFQTRPAALTQRRPTDGK
jgi:hypothetical protein